MEAVLLTKKIDASVAWLLGVYIDIHSEQMEGMAVHGGFSIARDRLSLRGPGGIRPATCQNRRLELNFEQTQIRETLTLRDSLTRSVGSAWTT